MWNLRGARRRPRVDRLLPPRRNELCFVLTLPRPDREIGGGAVGVAKRKMKKKGESRNLKFGLDGEISVGLSRKLSASPKFIEFLRTNFRDIFSRSGTFEIRGGLKNAADFYFLKQPSRAPKDHQVFPVIDEAGKITKIILKNGSRFELNNVFVGGNYPVSRESQPA